MALLSSFSILFARLRGGVLRGFSQTLWPRLRSSVTFKFLGAGALALVLAFSLTAQDVQAKRMGGGRSIGRQSHSFQQPHRAAPNQNQQASRNQNPASPPAAQPQRNRWLGPLAGLAAGLGIAALMSHLGLGGALGGMLSSLLVVGLIGLAAFFIIRLISSRRSNTDVRNEPAFKPAFSTGQTAEPFTPTPANAAEPAPLNTIDMPPRLPQPLTEAADFDSEAFLRAAKVLFIRLQTAWDAGNLDDIRKFTTAEMFAEVKLDITERGTTPSHTSVDQINAELLSIENQSIEPVASVRFSGLIRETQEQITAEPFTEVWNFTKEMNGEWKLGGIQQLD